MMTADLSFIEVLNLISLVASFASPRLHSAASIYASRASSISFLSLRLPKIDHILGGGLSRSSLIEVVGPAGVGKTQLCLTLTAVTGLAQTMGGLGEGTGVLYFDTEGKFSAQRLVEIAQAQAPTWFGTGGTTYSQTQTSQSSINENCEGALGFPSNGVTTARVVELLERTHVIPVENSEDFLVC